MKQVVFMGDVMTKKEIFETLSEIIANFQASYSIDEWKGQESERDRIAKSFSDAMRDEKGFDRESFLKNCDL